MMERIGLINDLESLLQECFKTIDNLRGPQQIKENDARVAFFKHLVNVINSTLLFLIMSKKYFVNYDNSTNECWWKGIQKEYNLSNRRFDFDRQRLYYDQVVTYSFLILIFSSFESSIRLITKQYDPTLYQSNESKGYSFNSLCQKLMRKLKLKSKTRKENGKFIDLIVLFRNSIHNNGAYMPRKTTKKPREIEWNNTVFRFVENELISQPQLWSNLISFSKEIRKIFTDIINSPEIKKISFYYDPAEKTI